MKKLMLLAAGIAASIVLMLAGCAIQPPAPSTTASTLATLQATAAQKLAALQSAANSACNVIQPTLQSVALLDPAVNAAATANGLFCGAVAALDVSTIQSIIKTGIPAVDSAINSSTVIKATDKPVIIAAIGIFVTTVQNALTAYQTAQAAAATAASEPAAASAPAAASTPLAGAPLQ